MAAVVSAELLQHLMHPIFYRLRRRAHRSGYVRVAIAIC